MTSRNVMKGIGASRFVAVALCVAFVGFLAVDFLRSPTASFAAVMADPWGRAILVDLYLGLLLIAAWAWVRERSRGFALIWTASFLLFGNIATLVYIARNLSQAEKASSSLVFFTGLQRKTS